MKRERTFPKGIISIIRRGLPHGPAKKKGDIYRDGGGEGTLSAGGKNGANPRYIMFLSAVDYFAGNDTIFRLRGEKKNGAKKSSDHTFVMVNPAKLDDCVDDAKPLPPIKKTTATMSQTAYNSLLNAVRQLPDRGATLGEFIRIARGQKCERGDAMYSAFAVSAKQLREEGKVFAASSPGGGKMTYYSYEPTLDEDFSFSPDAQLKRIENEIAEIKSLLERVLSTQPAQQG